jgi:hypothetical protein
MRFIVVNGRTPTPSSFCAQCCARIRGSYLRDIATRLTYCGHECYFDHFRASVVALQRYART